MKCPRCAATLPGGVGFCGFCGSSFEPSSKSLPAISETKDGPSIAKSDESQKPKVETKQGIQLPKPKRRWKKKLVGFKARLKELKSFSRGPKLPPKPEPAPKPEPEISLRTAKPGAAPTPLPKKSLLDLNQELAAVAIRTSEFQIVDDPVEDSYANNVAPKPPKPTQEQLSNKKTVTNEYAAIVAPPAAPPPKLPPAPPKKVSTSADFEEFAAVEKSTNTAQGALHIRTMELELVEEPQAPAAKHGYDPMSAASPAAPKPPPKPSYDPMSAAAKAQPEKPQATLAKQTEFSTPEPIVIDTKPSGDDSIRDSGEQNLKKAQKKSSRYLFAALGITAAAIGAYLVSGIGSSQANPAQSVTAAIPTPKSASTPAAPSNDAKIAEAASLALQGKWNEAAKLAEEANRPDLAKRYRIESEVSQNLADCRKAREEKRLEDAMAACHLVEIAENSQAATTAIPEIEETKKAYKAKHIPYTKKELSKNDTVRLANAKREIDLLATYLGASNPEVIALQKAYQEQLKKLPAKEAALAKNDTPSKTPEASLTPIKTPIATPTPTPAPITSGGSVYLVSGAYVTVGKISNSTKDASLASKYQSALNRAVASSGKSAAPPSGKSPITIIGTVKKAETKTSGGDTSVYIAISYQITRDASIIAFGERDGTMEFSGSISASQEKSAKEDLLKVLADAVFSDIKKKLGKLK